MRTCISCSNAQSCCPGRLIDTCLLLNASSSHVQFETEQNLTVSTQPPLSLRFSATRSFTHTALSCRNMFTVLMVINNTTVCTRVVLHRHSAQSQHVLKSKFIYLKPNGSKAEHLKKKFISGDGVLWEPAIGLIWDPFISEQVWNQLKNVSLNQMNDTVNYLLTKKRDPRFLSECAGGGLNL